MPRRSWRAFGAARAALESRGRADGDSLNIGVLELVETHLMPRVLPPLLERAPGLRVVTTAERNSAELLGLREGVSSTRGSALTYGSSRAFVSLRLLWDPFCWSCRGNGRHAPRARRFQKRGR